MRPGGEAEIHVVPYDASWPRRFDEEQRVLARAIGGYLAGAIEHVGSTAVPGLAAKPVIDIIAGVDSLDRSRPAIAVLERLGYRYFPYRPDEEHWFCKPSPQFRTHHLHLIPFGSVGRATGLSRLPAGASGRRCGLRGAETTAGRATQVRQGSLHGRQGPVHSANGRTRLVVGFAFRRTYNSRRDALNPGLHVLCGKLASGKTTLANEIAAETGAVLIREDVWLLTLFPGEIDTFADYLQRSARFRRALAPHVRNLLRAGVSIVFDFAGNVPQERAWARSLADAEHAPIVIHYLKASDELCKRHLRRRNEERPDGSQPTTEDEFDAITKYFVPPDPAEGIEVKEYDAESRLRP